MVSIEEHIRKAMEEGKFDNLPGAGKPLHLDDNPWEDPEWSMAHRMLRNADIPLPWIAARKEIKAELERARSALARTWGWKQGARAAGHPAGFIEDAWQRATRTFTEQVSAINKRIQAFNMEAPAAQFQLYPVDAERELVQLTGSTRSDTL